MNTPTLSCVLTTILLLAGCGTAYHPITNYGGIPAGGYSSTQIDGNTVLVTFNGNIFTASQTVNSDVLYRAAKITMESGYDYFVVVTTSTCPKNVDVQTTVIQRETQPPRLFNSLYNVTQIESYRTTHGSFPCAPTNSHESSAVIKMFKGRIPPGLPRAYSPADIFAHLGSNKPPHLPPI